VNARRFYCLVVSVNDSSLERFPTLPILFIYLKKKKKKKKRLLENIRICWKLVKYTMLDDIIQSGYRDS
jgi:hypothetical protein